MIRDFIKIIFRKKPAVPVEADPQADPALSIDATKPKPAPSPSSTLSIAVKSLAVVILGNAAQQIAEYGIEATPFAALPASWKLTITLIAPLVVAYLAKSPRK